MTPDDATKTMAILTSAWPHADLPEETLLLWMNMLTDVDPTDAATAAKHLIRSEHFFPSIAKFLNEAEAQAHSRRNREATERGLPSGHKPVEPPTRLLASSRQLLDEISAKHHDHHGPQPCPICGGMA